jgi:signal transduction histidine kinase
LTNILNYVRPLKIDLTNIDIKIQLHEIIEHIRHDDSVNKPIKFIEVYPDGKVEAAVDPILFKSAILNLIVNGIQSMEKGGELKVEVKKDKAFATILISDNGEGIPEANLEKIFRPFFTTKPSGHGFGLAEVHRVIQAHNATISVESKVGQGTVFTLTFPINNILSKKDTNQ